MKTILMTASVICLFALSAFAQDTDTKPKFERLDNGLVQATYYHADGTVRETGFFKNKKLHGAWLRYDEDGNIMTKAKYDQGKRTGVWLFWEDDKLREVTYDKHAIVEVTTWTNSTTLVKNMP